MGTSCRVTCAAWSGPGRCVRGSQARTHQILSSRALTALRQVAFKRGLEHKRDKRCPRLRRGLRGDCPRLGHWAIKIELKKAMAPTHHHEYHAKPPHRARPRSDGHRRPARDDQGLPIILRDRCLSLRRIRPSRLSLEDHHGRTRSGHSWFSQPANLAKAILEKVIYHTIAPRPIGFYSPTGRLPARDLLPLRNNGTRYRRLEELRRQRNNVIGFLV